MFPKAHAVAYVMMAIRIAWFKVYKPLAYYAAFFSIRAKTFDYETMARGRDTLDKNLDMLLHMEKPTAKDKESIKDMRIVQEMYARGIKFEPIDLYKVKEMCIRDSLAASVLCMENNMPMLIFGLNAVSYTHLAVYKRQR